MASLNQDHVKAIETYIKNNKIFIFMKGDKSYPQCGFSARVADVFNSLNVPFETCNVLENYDLFQTLKQYSNWPTSPQVFINGELIGGCDITMELFESGELQQMVDKALA